MEGALLFPLKNKKTGWFAEGLNGVHSDACPRQASLLNPTQAYLHVTICAE